MIWWAQTLEFTIEEVNADRNVSNNAKNRQVVLNLYEKGILISKMPLIRLLNGLISLSTPSISTFANSKVATS